MMMRAQVLSLALLGWISAPAIAGGIADEKALREALDAASLGRAPAEIHLQRGVEIRLSAPLVYDGSRPLAIIGNGAVLDGRAAGHLTRLPDKSARSSDATIVLKTSAGVTIRDLTIRNSATRGIALMVPINASGEVSLMLDHVTVERAALYGIHVDDNADPFDEGDLGSPADVRLEMHDCRVEGAGTGALDFDGVRVDERGDGDIRVRLENVTISGNGGDGIELDEGGSGDVVLEGRGVTLDNNGFFNAEDLDDGLDIDEDGDGAVLVHLVDMQLHDNQDEGLDLDEAGPGDLRVDLTSVYLQRTRDEAIKLDEEGSGDLGVSFSDVQVADGQDDGIQLTEVGQGRIIGSFERVAAKGNAKCGIKIEQWADSEDEKNTREPIGHLQVDGLDLEGNGKGNEPCLHHVVLQ